MFSVELHLVGGSLVELWADHFEFAEMPAAFTVTAETALFIVMSEIKLLEG